MKKPPIFILSSGRSGSTLLQRILNSYPDITVWGEHGGFLKETAAAFFRLLENRGNNEFVFPRASAEGGTPWELIVRSKQPDQWQAWLNHFVREDLPGFFRRHLESFFCPPAMPVDGHWGFKEIRYGRYDRVVEFLASLYPDARFVFLARNAFNTIASQEKAFACRSRLGAVFPSRDFRSASRLWRTQTESLWNWHVSGKLTSFWITYEDLCVDLACLAPLLTSLGKEAGPAQQKVLEMDEGRGSAFATKGTDRWQALGYLQLCWADLAVGNLNECLGYRSPRMVAWLGPVRRRIGRRPRTRMSEPTVMAGARVKPSPQPTIESVVPRGTLG
jgi:hypothetical protein